MELSYANNPKSLFRKHSKLITEFAKSNIGGDYLTSQTPFFKKSKNIKLFLPNGYIEKDGDYKATFTTKAVFASLIYKTLTKIDIAREYYKDLNQNDLLRMMFLDLNLIKPQYNYPQVLLNTSTFNPNANPEITSVDGYAARSGVTETWGTLVAGAGNTSDDLSASAFMEAASAGTNPNWAGMYRMFTLFDTSTLTTSATIVSAVESLWLLTDGNFTENQRLVTTTPASNTAIVNADYAQFGTTAQATDIGTGTVGAYTDWTLNATGLSNISKTGITKFGIRLAKDADNTTPTWPGAGQITKFREYTTAEGTNKPKLVVTFTLPTNNNNFSYFM